MDQFKSKNNVTSEVVLALEKSLGPIYTGGRVQLVNAPSEGNARILLKSDTKYAIRDTITGEEFSGIQMDEEESSISLFSLKTAETLVTCNSDNLFEVWPMLPFTSTLTPSNGPIRSWKGHASPIMVMTHHATYPLLATGSADHGVRVWDSDKGCCTHNLKGVHGAIITALAFHPNENILKVVSGAEDGSIAVWDLIESRINKTIKGGHMNTITSLDISNDGKMLLSAGRDQVVNLWDLGGSKTFSEEEATNGKSFKKPGKGKDATKGDQPLGTIAVMDVVEAAGFLPDGKRFFTGGKKGILQVWEAKTGKLLCSSERLTSENHTITQAKIISSEELLVITSDLLLIYLDAKDLSIRRTMIGHQGEVTDAVLFRDAHLIVATNSAELHAYPYHDQQALEPSCTLLKGHEEAVISLAVNSEYIISGSRDHNAILWSSDNDNKDIKPFVKLTGHTDVVSAVALGHKTALLAATGSADTTLKLWNGQDLKWTIKAHDKDINSVIFTPNDKYLLSASQDKTVKVWQVKDGKLFLTLKGHKRGVWNVAVSPKEQLVATASADKSIKLWSLVDGTCLKTLEGHSNSVLRIAFTNDGTRLVSTGSDGLIKIWNLKKSISDGNECISTIDAHDDRIWTLFILPESSKSLNSKSSIISGDASGMLKIWKDITEQLESEKSIKKNETILKEQELSNAIMRRDFKNAVSLAMQLEQPNRLYSLFGQLVDGRSIPDAIKLLTELLDLFSDEERYRLLNWLRDWNTSLKRSYTTQLILHVLLKYWRQHPSAESSDDLKIKEILKQIKPFNQKHYEKLDSFLTSSYLIDFTISKIK